MSKGSGLCETPAERFNIDGFYGPRADLPATVASRDGYYLREDVRQFDNSFFGINNLEATHIDPQQRKLLETTYESLESAGVSLKSLESSNTGVYVGNFTNDYRTMQNSDPSLFTRYSATGASSTVLANRISYCFNLHGPRWSSIPHAPPRSAPFIMQQQRSTSTSVMERS